MGLTAQRLLWQWQSSSRRASSHNHICSPPHRLTAVPAHQAHLLTAGPAHHRSNSPSSSAFTIVQSYSRCHWTTCNLATYLPSRLKSRQLTMPPIRNSRNSRQTRTSLMGITPRVSPSWIPNPEFPTPDYASFRPRPMSKFPSLGFSWGSSQVLFTPRRLWGRLEPRLQSRHPTCFDNDFLERALAAFPTSNGPDGVPLILTGQIAMGPVIVVRTCTDTDTGEEHFDWQIDNEPVFGKESLPGPHTPNSAKLAMLINAILFHLDRQYEKEAGRSTNNIHPEQANALRRLKVCPLMQRLQPSPCMRPWLKDFLVTDQLPFDAIRPEIVLYDSHALNVAPTARTDVHLPQGLWQPQDLLDLHQWTSPKQLTLRQALCSIVPLHPSRTTLRQALCPIVPLHPSRTTDTPASPTATAEDITTDQRPDVWYHNLVEPIVHSMRRVRTQQVFTLEIPHPQWSIRKPAPKRFNVADCSAKSS